MKQTNIGTGGNEATKKTHRAVRFATTTNNWGQYFIVGYKSWQPMPTQSAGATCMVGYMTSVSVATQLTGQSESYIARSKKKRKKEDVKRMQNWTCTLLSRTQSELILKSRRMERGKPPIKTVLNKCDVEQNRQHNKIV